MRLNFQKIVYALKNFVTKVKRKRLISYELLRRVNVYQGMAGTLVIFYRITQRYI
jgi:hypothetical protein